MLETQVQCSEDRPLVTFALFAYNQEKYIREAVEGALAQTYSPLEIILSDDCSGDRTFDLIKELVDEYKGAHKVILNRNEVNLGIAGHVNRIMELAHGELIVAAAGDDISHPNRAEKLFTLWAAHNRKAFSIFSDFIEFHEFGESYTACSEINFYTDFEDFSSSARKAKIKTLGATQAWSRQVFDLFGPINSRLNAEDNIIPFRAMLLGGIIFCHEPLVRYRISMRSSEAINYFDNYREGYLKYHAALALTVSEMIRECDCAANIKNSSVGDLISARESLRERHEKLMLVLEIITSSSKVSLRETYVRAQKLGVSLRWLLFEKVKYIFPSLYKQYWLLRYRGKVRVKWY